jgi:hypothetical protein
MNAVAPGSDILAGAKIFREKQVADKEEMIEVFEDLFSTAKMEIMTNRADMAGNRQLLGQVRGFFLAMKMTVPVDAEEVEYVENRLRLLEERIG